MHSWQAHLERISHYLIYGEGVLWEYRNGSFVFYDGDSDEDFQDAGPGLHHFQNSSIKNIIESSKQKWLTVIEDNIKTPITYIHIFDQTGNLSSVKNYFTMDVTELQKQNSLTSPRQK